MWLKWDVRKQHRKRTWYPLSRLQPCFPSFWTHITLGWANTDFLGPRPIAGTLKSLSLSFLWSPEGSLSNQTQKWKRKSSSFIAQLITHPSAINISNKIPPSPQQTHNVLAKDRPHTSLRDCGWNCAEHSLWAQLGKTFCSSEVTGSSHVMIWMEISIFWFKSLLQSRGWRTFFMKHSLVNGLVSAQILTPLFNCC